MKAWPLAIVCTVWLVGAAPASAQVDPRSDPAQVLAERYAPIVVLKQQRGPCDTRGEAFAPMSVDLLLDNDDVMLRQEGVGDPVVRRAPTAADLHGRGEGFYLDFNGLALSRGCVFEKDFNRYRRGSNPVVYAHVVKQADRPGQLAVQYWSFWYYNDWVNVHEGDWELTQVLFDASTVAEALESKPVSVGYAQHEGGERADWDSAKLRREGTHPVVFPSAGSHAGYFSSDVFLGRRGSEGFGCDSTVGPSTTTRPDVVMLPGTPAAGGADAWLDFGGRWGERHPGPFNGPTGPAMKPQWKAPVDWQRSLRSSSVVIPGGSEGSGTVLDTFCSSVDFGSNKLRILLMSPAQTLLVLVAAAFAVRALARRTAWSTVPAVPLRQPRRIGQMIRGSFASYWTSRGAMAGIGLVFIPAAVLVGVAAAVADLMVGQSVAAGLSAVLLVLAASLIAAFWHLAGDQDDQGLADAARLVRRRLPALIATVLRGAVIVLGLAATVVGIPWAIRQAVRYEFAIPVVVTEDLSGAAALRRSAALVRGRWWRTALPLVLFAGLAAVITGAVELVLLIVLSGVPLWLYLGISFAAVGLVAPLLATPAVLLYGDAAARAQAQPGVPVP